MNIFIFNIFIHILNHLLKIFNIVLGRYSKSNFGSQAPHTSYEITNGLLGMKKYVILKLIIIHNNQMLYETERVMISLCNSFYKETQNRKIMTTCLKPLSSFEIHRNKENFKKKHKKYYEKYCGNIYICNNILTVKHISAISQELLCLENHCYYKNNFIYFEYPIHQVFPILTLDTIYT
jgi:hypothetical protein